jgi:hypothetical protein
LIVVALAKKYREAAYPFKGEFVWCYVGKDIKFRERVGRALGRERRFFLGSRLYRIAEDIRQPFLDFIAALGSRQKDKLNWWASRFASRDALQNDFFLINCYRHLVDDIIEEFRREDADICVLIQDRWLYRELKEYYSSNSDVRFIGKERLIASMAYSLLRGTFFRFLLVFWFGIAKGLVYYYHGGERPGVLDSSNKAVGLLSYPMKKAFKNGDYSDPCSGDLFRLFEKRGIRYFYLYYSLSNLSVARNIGKNKKKLWPLILEVRLMDVIKRIFERWVVTSPENVFSARGKNWPLKYLIKGELYKEYSDTGFNQRLVQFDALERFFTKNWCSSIYYTFENQPIEKMLCMAAHRFDVRLIGYQHTSISRFFLSHFLGRNEADFMPLPDRLLTAGSYVAELLIDGGIPEGKITKGGAWRFLHIYEEQGRVIERPANEKITVLVALSLHPEVSKSMLEAVFEVFLDEEQGRIFELWIKPHPVMPFSRLGIERDSGYKVLEAPFNELLNGCDVLFTSFSATGLEAYLSGKRVVTYLPENIIVSDPLVGISDERIYCWHEGDAIDMEFVRKAEKVSIPTDEKEKFFGKIRESAWLEPVE